MRPGVYFHRFHPKADTAIERLQCRGIAPGSRTIIATFAGLDGVSTFGWKTAISTLRSITISLKTCAKFHDDAAIAVFIK